MLFFPGVPTVVSSIIANRMVISGAAASVGVSYLFSPLKTAIYGVCGALQGAFGAMALSIFGVNCSMVTAAAVGGLAGAAIAAPFAITMGLIGLFGAEKAEGYIPAMGRIILSVGIMFLSSLIMSMALFLGSLPVAAVGMGAAAYEISKEALGLTI